MGQKSVPVAVDGTGGREGSSEFGTCGSSSWSTVGADGGTGLLVSDGADFFNFSAACCLKLLRVDRIELVFALAFSEACSANVPNVTLAS